MKTCILGTLMFFALTVSAQAAFIFGVVEFETKIIPNTGSLNQAITFSEMKSTVGTGFFNGFPATHWDPLALPAGPGLGQPVVLSAAEFGTFTGTVTEDAGEKLESTGAFRSIIIDGGWVPGTLSVFNGFRDPVQARFYISLKRDANTGTTIVPTSIFYAKGIPVPEPALGFGVPLALTVAGLVYRRRQRVAAAVPTV
ncbi:MAG: hypothetical protein RLZZ232_3148 [Planctomycetota bacterium]|jgi:hypothetical protein